MPELRDCIDAVVEASGRHLTDDEALEVLERVQDMRERARREGDIEAADRRLVELAAQEADEVKIAAALQKKQAALNAIVRDRLEANHQALRDVDYTPPEALRVLMHGGNRRGASVRDSVAATQAGMERRYLGALLGKIAAERPHLEEQLSRGLFIERKGRQEFFDRVGREMWELHDGGNPGVTKDADAEWLAKQLADVTELARRDLNRLGANIGKLDDHGYIPQRHDAWRMLKVSEQDWVDEIAPRLDYERSFPDIDENEARAVLGEIYRTVVTGQDGRIRPENDGAIKGPANLAKRLSHQRVLHFRSYDDWAAYNKAFGYGDTLSTVVEHWRLSARIGGQMKVLGPNPEAMLRGFADKQSARLSRDRGVTPKQAADWGKELRDVEKWAAFKVMTGEAFAVRGRRLAAGGSFIRTWETISKLGSVVISSITDPVTLAGNLRFQGNNIAQAYGRVFQGYFSGRGKEEQREIGFLLGEGFDGLIDSMVSAYTANDTATGFASRAMTTFFRLNGLTWFTDTGRSVGARLMAADMGRRAGKRFDELDERYRNVLELQGITPAKWDVIRQAKFEGNNGSTYITPDKIRDLDDSAFDALIAEPLDQADLSPEARQQLLERARFDLEVDLQRFIRDEVSFGIIESDARTRAVTSGGFQSGTPAREAWAMIMQFKAYPVAFTQRVLGRSLRSGPAYSTTAERLLKNSLHFGELLAVLWIAGLMATWGKDVAKGRTPKELWSEDEGLNLKTIGAAFMQSGGLGLYGDFLFADRNRFGGAWWQSLTGPFVGDVGTIGDIVLEVRDQIVKGEADGEKLVRDGVRLFQGLTPGASLPGVKPALDLLFLNSLREALQPGFLRRQERWLEQNYGQEFYVPRSLN